MKKQLREKEQLLEKIETFISGASQGGLKFQQKNGRTYYYHQFKNPATEKWEKTYIKKNQMDLTKELAKKGYLMKVKAVLTKQLLLLQSFVKEYDEDALEQIYRELPKERKVFVEPISIGVREKLEAWNSETYEPYRAFPENLVYETVQGEIVRSKSEVIIANVLYQYKDDISYKYERPLELKTKDGKTMVVYPDFTIINKHTGKVYYYEHAGRMDEPRYAVDFVKKINLYTLNGILQGRDLLVTYESHNVPLDTNSVRKIVENILR